jgi:hypothetical protein
MNKREREGQLGLPRVYKDRESFFLFGCSVSKNYVLPGRYKESFKAFIFL